MTFAGDEFEGEGRGKIAEQQLTKNKLPWLVIDKDQAFKGHFAGWLPIFDYAYGPCISHFLENPGAETCKLAPLSNSDVRSVVAIAQVADADKKIIETAAPLVGKKYVAYPLEAFMRHYEYVSPSQRHTMVSITTFDETVESHNGIQCAHRTRETCSKLVRWSDHTVLEFDPAKGDLRAWWFEQ